MTKEEFEYWVKFVGENGYKVSSSLFRAGYECWHARASLGRFLGSRTYRQLDPAIRLLKTVVRVRVKNEECGGHMTDVEDKAWALQVLGIAIWHHTQDAKKALHYIDLALSLAERFPGHYSFITRGEIWSHHLNLLRHMGKGAKAQKEVTQKLSAVSDQLPVMDSYYFYGNLLLADLSADADNIPQALEHLHAAFSKFPLEYWTLGEFQQLWDTKAIDPRATYHSLRNLAEERKDWIWGDWWTEGQDDISVENVESGGE